MADLEAWVANATAVGEVAVDTETTSLDAMQADLVGVSVSVKPGVACYIPLDHKAPVGQATLDLGDGGDSESAVPEQLDRDAALAVLKPMLEDPGVLKIGQNIKYDLLILGRYGVDVAPIDDTMLLSYVLEGGLHGHGMDELSRLHFDISPVPFKEVAGSGKAAITFDYVPLDKAVDYAAEDADITLRLHRVLKPRLASDRMTTVYETMERPLAPVLVAMERAGIRVDAQVLQGLSDDFAVRMAEFQNQIFELAGEEFNINSPKQLGEILFDKNVPAGR